MKDVLLFPLLTYSAIFNDRATWEAVLVQANENRNVTPTSSFTLKRNYYPNVSDNRKKKIFVVTSCPPNFHTNPLTRNFDHNRRISSRESAKTSAKYSNVNIRQRNSWKNCPTQISREKETLYQLYIYIYSMVDSINVSLNCEFPRSTSTK